MKIIIDDKIPYIRGALEPFAEVAYLPGHLTTPDAARDAHALVTRTRTICDRRLLQGSKVKFIATATAGFDHIDTEYCKSAGIEWINAPGCNAESVNQYVTSALFAFASRRGLALKGKTIGIVGVGQVGSRVAKTCEILGMKVLLNDPPRARAEGPAGFVPLSLIRETADIITFHVPLNMEGVDRTHHMADGGFLRGLRRTPLLINTCRGEVFDTAAVVEAKRAGTISGIIIDCWENEPSPDAGLLELADIATPHIAGYSKDGKANGTRVCVRALGRFFGLGLRRWEPAGIESPGNAVIELDGAGRDEESILAQAVLHTYHTQRDDHALRADPRSFEQLRGDYPVRREFDYFCVRAVNLTDATLGKLAALGFSAA